jgi:hypothetical protein
MRRRTETTIAEYEKIGEALFRAIYGETADSVQKLLDSAYPDMGEEINRNIHALAVNSLVRRMVLQHHWLWLDLWVYRGPITSGDLLHNGGSFDRWRYSASNYLASRWCAQRRCKPRGSSSRSEDLHGSCQPFRHSMERRCPRGQGNCCINEGNASRSHQTILCYCLSNP